MREGGRGSGGERKRGREQVREGGWEEVNELVREGGREGGRRESMCLLKGW